MTQPAAQPEPLPDDLRATVRGFVVNRLRGDPALLAAVRECLDAGYRVVVAWSFYSASFPGAAEELAQLILAATVFLAGMPGRRSGPTRSCTSAASARRRAGRRARSR